MTKQEIIKALEENDKRQFFLMMKDMWDSADYRLDRQLRDEEKRLKELLEKAE